MSLLFYFRMMFLLLTVGVLVSQAAANSVFVAGIRCIEQKPVIDGKLDDATWVEVARSSKGVFSGWKDAGGTRLIENQRISFVAYDKEGLYIGTKVFVENTGKLKPDPGGKNFFWYDDSLEVHLVNEMGEYFQIAVNCRGICGLGPDLRLIHFKAASHLAKNCWSAEFAIPWRELDIEPVRGTEIRFNLAGHDYLDSWVSWGNVSSIFKSPEKFSCLRLD